MPKKRVVISQDYDGCYSIVASGGVDAELKGTNQKFYLDPKYQSLVTRLRQLPDTYKHYLTDITAKAHAVSVYVGSDRQSFRLDQHNASKNRNGSVFPALRELCYTRTTITCPWTFEPFLLADTEHTRGEALRRMDSISEDQLEFLHG